jgi:hypothetical protein
MGVLGREVKAEVLVDFEGDMHYFKLSTVLSPVSDTVEREGARNAADNA